MAAREFRKASVAAAATAVAAGVQAAEPASVDALLAAIKGADEKARGAAWQGAGPCGAPAIQPLAAVMVDADFEIARSAMRAVWKIVRHAGRPGAQEERIAVIRALSPLLDDEQPVVVRREVLWMLSEIAGERAVPRVAALLAHAELREDARTVLVRLPGQEAVQALQAALASAPAEFKPALADALRARGVDTPGVPSLRLKPVKQTNVKPIGPA